ncbi:flagellar hook-associated protein [Chania multitudinisentens RB-25]|uniref:Flagellar hook-associated protein n=2 Tax=Chania TaxID=1745211 RepID=W0LBA7_9GAMM|nr:flagellar hook-associated protein [Chania multitudinisentens RB-25]
MLTHIGANSTQINKLMEQLSTLKRVNVPSDDPVAACRLVQMNREQSAIKQYQDNISVLRNSLGVQEAQITTMDHQLQEIKTKLLAANNSSHSSQDMSGFGTELASMLEMLVQTANAKNESGGYLFSGTKTTTTPVQLDNDGNYVFAGNDQGRATSVANGVSIQENVNLAYTLSSAGNDLELLNKLKELSQKMQDPELTFTDYNAEITAMLDKVQHANDQVAAIYTDIGGRQNRLSLLEDAHVDINIANADVIRDLSETDQLTATTNLQLYIQSVQITNKAYSMISQLNLFSQM